jgi:hypothetical protein
LIIYLSIPYDSKQINVIEEEKGGIIEDAWTRILEGYSRMGGGEVFST